MEKYLSPIPSKSAWRKVVPRLEEEWLESAEPIRLPESWTTNSHAMNPMEVVSFDSRDSYLFPTG